MRRTTRAKKNIIIAVLAASMLTAACSSGAQAPEADGTGTESTEAASTAGLAEERQLPTA